MPPASTKGHPSVIEIFDRKKLRLKRNRAAGRFAEHDFLFKWTAEALADRLKDVKRDFALSLQTGARGGSFIPAGRTVIMDMAGDYLRPGTPAVQGDEELLPFAPDVFDLVVSPLSLHTVNDLPGALIQINRILNPDGLFLGALFGRETLYELRQSLMQAEINIKGGAGPRVAPFADKKQMGALMQRAKFALPVVDSEKVTATYETVTKLMHDLRYMGEASCLKEGCRPLSRTLLAETERLYRENYSDQDGRLEATFEIIFLIGWSPHESQQKPQRPGSAEKRLADELGTEEVGSGVKTSE